MRSKLSCWEIRPSQIEARRALRCAARFLPATAAGGLGNKFLSPLQRPLAFARAQMQDYQPRMLSTYALTLFRHNAEIDGQPVKVDFWDTAG